MFVDRLWSVPTSGVGQWHSSRRRQESITIAHRWLDRPRGIRKLYPGDSKVCASVKRGSGAHQQANHILWRRDKNEFWSRVQTPCQCWPSLEGARGPMTHLVHCRNYLALHLADEVTPAQFLRNNIWQNHHRADSRFASLQSNAVSHWLGANLDSAL